MLLAFRLFAVPKGYRRQRKGMMKEKDQLFRTAMRTAAKISTMPMT